MPTLAYILDLAESIYHTSKAAAMLHCGYFFLQYN